jgi:hypothetical protein
VIGLVSEAECGRRDTPLPAARSILAADDAAASTTVAATVG